MPRPALIPALAALVLGLLLPAAPASATFPGENGKLAVRQGPPNFRIATVNPDGSGLTQITSGSDSFPAWSPDGESLAFYRFESGRASLWVTRSDGSEPRNLATD